MTITDTRPRARVEHACLLCTYAIRPGTRYVYRTGVDDDRWWTMRAHVGCDALAVARDMYDDRGVDEGGLAETLAQDAPVDTVRWTGGRWGAGTREIVQSRGVERLLYWISVAAEWLAAERTGFES